MENEVLGGKCKNLKSEDWENLENGKSKGKSEGFGEVFQEIKKGKLYLV